MITLLYVRPASDRETELDQRIGTIARRYAEWVELRVIGPEQLGGAPAAVGRVARAGSPAVFLLRGGDLLGEAVGASLPARELDRAVRRAVEWPVPT